MKKIFLMTAFAVITTMGALAQTTGSAPASSTERNGYRIFNMYGGIFPSFPMGDLGKVTNVGAGGKFGCVFNFSKEGFNDGLLNVGLRFDWLNAEINFPDKSFYKSNDNSCIGVFQTLGPQLTLNPKGPMFIDFYVMPGYGARAFTEDDDDTHIALATSYGINFRYKALYTGINFQHLNGYTIADSNFKTGGSTTFQLTIGVCMWRVQK